MDREETQHIPFDDEEFTQAPKDEKVLQIRTPQFDVLMNSVRSLTRKVDHLNGFRFELGGSLSNNLHLTGTINMPNPTLPKKASPFGMPPSDSKGDFQLGIQYLHGPVSQVQQPKLIMTGRVDTSGKVESVIMKKLTDGVNLRFNAGFLNSDVNYAQAGFDLNFDDPECTKTVKYGNQVDSFSMMQRIGNRLCLGFEMMHLSQRNMFMFNYGAKYRAGLNQNYLLQYMAPNKSFVLAYSNNILKNAQFISEIEYGAMDGKTKTILGYKQKFNNCEILNTVSGNGKISSSFNFVGFAYQVKLCAAANYIKQSYKFGYGIAFGQVQ